jgi:hypothetical protein
MKEDSPMQVLNHGIVSEGATINVVQQDCLRCEGSGYTGYHLEIEDMSLDDKILAEHCQKAFKPAEFYKAPLNARNTPRETGTLSFITRAQNCTVCEGRGFIEVFKARIPDTPRNPLTDELISEIAGLVDDLRVDADRRARGWAEADLLDATQLEDRFTTLKRTAAHLWSFVAGTSDTFVQSLVRYPLA